MLADTHCKNNKTSQRPVVCWCIRVWAITRKKTWLLLKKTVPMHRAVLILDAEICKTANEYSSKRSRIVSSSKVKVHSTSWSRDCRSAWSNARPPSWKKEKSRQHISAATDQFIGRIAPIAIGETLGARSRAQSSSRNILSRQQLQQQQCTVRRTPDSGYTLHGNECGFFPIKTPNITSRSSAKSCRSFADCWTHRIINPSINLATSS